jgi:hypothetical protein
MNGPLPFPIPLLLSLSQASQLGIQYSSLRSRHRSSYIRHLVILG